MGFRPLVFRRSAIQATGCLTFTQVGLTPTDDISLHWTHSHTVGFPESGRQQQHIPGGPSSTARGLNARSYTPLGCSVIPPARRPVRLSPYPGTVSRRCFLLDARRLPRAPSPEAGVTHHQDDLKGHLGGNYPSFNAHTDSCAGPRPSHLPRFPSVSGSVQVVARPCWELALPGVISENLSLDAWIHTPVVPLVHIPVASQRASAFAVPGMARHSTCDPYRDFCTGDLTGLQSFDDLQASRFACHPDRSYRRVSNRLGAAVAFTSEHLTVCYLPVPRIC